MLGGKGFYRGSTILVSGTAGTGKRSLAANFVHAACGRGERCLYFSFEESPGQMIRNMRSIGLDLKPWVKKNLLSIHASRPTFHGLEMHLATIHKLIHKFKPQVVVLDPIGGLIAAGSRRDANTMLIRLIDFLKLGGITAFLTNLTSGGAALERTEVEISSLVDTWLLNRDIELGGERNRAMYVLKSRGMPHSNELREFLLTDRGFELLDSYVGPEGTLTGSSRLSQEAGDESHRTARQQEASESERGRKRKREAFEARIIALRTEFEAEGEQAERLATQAVARDKVIAESREVMGRRRHAYVGKASAGSRKISRSRNEKLGKTRPAATS